MSSDLWTEASVDVEAEHTALRRTRAKVACASLWPFLALARTEGEFEHRLALVSEHIAERVEVDLIDPVVASLREDFLAVTASMEKDEDGDDDEDRYESAQHQGAKDAEGKEHADEDEDGDGKPDWLAEKIKSKKKAARAVTAYFDQGLQRWVKTADIGDENDGMGNPWYFTGGPEAGPATGETNQFPTFPQGSAGDPWNPINQQYPAQPSAWTVPPGGEWKEAPMNFSPPNGQHAASRLPFAEAKTKPGDTDTCRSCGNSIKAVKVSWGKGVDWTHTGRHGASADDDHSPVPSKLTRKADLRTATEGIVPTPGPNPAYFSGGGEGAAGDEQSGFPQDVTLPEDEEDRASEYGAVPPQRSSGTTGARRTATEEHDAPDSEPNLGTEYDSSQEGTRYRRAQHGEKPGDRNSAVGARHAFYDPADPAVRMVAADNMFSPPNTVGGTPQPPPAMTSGGPGAESVPPMDAGPSSTPAATTKPRQMPGGGGMPGGGIPGGGDVNNPTPDPTQATASRHLGEGMNRARPTITNPYGTDDPFDAKTWDNAATQRPMVGMEHMNFNGPQNPNAREKIRTTTSPGENREEDDEEEEGR